ncbi:MAG: nucleotidyltransferase substrate binding protein [Deltaproteobacteria bacterium]|nr:nucleotidyltransferase substrate binding protein [Deltaproteobacteria bacterium]
MALDLSNLRKAILALDRSLTIAHSGGESMMSEDLRDTIRAGVIQNFEVAYEQCWKYIQRWIHDNRSPEEANHPRTRKELFRMAARSELIADPSPWFGYGDARNLTSRTYDEHHALTVFEAAERFIGDARDLLHRLDDRND